VQFARPISRLNLYCSKQRERVAGAAVTSSTARLPMTHLHCKCALVASQRCTSRVWAVLHIVHSATYGTTAMRSTLFSTFTVALLLCPGRTHASAPLSACQPGGRARRPATLALALPVLASTQPASLTALGASQLRQEGLASQRALRQLLSSRLSGEYMDVSVVSVVFVSAHGVLSCYALHGDCRGLKQQESA
jgi:hypothetical protein